MELWSEDRDPKTIKGILEKIEVLWGNSHDLRFNQDERMMRNSKRNTKIEKHTKFSYFSNII